ncbi:ankyrin repeat domain-containing protein [Wolbachia endosymbiont (group A) of Myopa testacea]|uniref:ankyrin repeat domain-containing protein n=1 Tax=Wolbachia endosymbiont (group A) of Myopa testacea TaxID=3066148 RepID=UPI0031330EEF
MEYGQWIKILRAVNADGDLNQDNIIEKIRKELKAADLVVYEKWRKANFSVNHFFCYYCSSNSHYEPLLKLAIQIDCVKIVEVLIDKGVGVNSLLNGNKDTPLSLAYFWRRAEIIKVLIDKGADVDTSGNGRRLLVQAAEHGYIDILNILIDKWVDVNIDTFDMRLGKCTPLILAAEYGHGGVVKALIDNGADVNKAGLDGWTILLSAFKKGHFKGGYRESYRDVVKALIDKVPDVDRAVPDLHKASGKWTLLLWAAENGYIDIVEALINKGADVNKISQGRYTPLSLAAQYGHVGVVRILINNGASVNVNLTNWTHSPIHNASYGGHKKVVELLLEGGVDVDAMEGDCETTPLLSATYKGRKEVVELLLKKGADVNKADKHGRTPLSWAVSEYKIDVCEPIVNHITKLEADGLYVSPENLQLKAEIMPKIEVSIFLYNHEPLLINVLPPHYLWKTLDEIKAFLEENREKLKVKLGVHEKPLIDFVDFKDVAVRHTPRLELCAAVSAVIKNNASSGNLGNPSTKQLQQLVNFCSSSVDEQVPQLASETTGTIEHISASDSEHGEVSEGDSTKILVSDQKIGIQNNNQQPSKPSAAAPRSEKRTIIAASVLAIAGVALGITIAVYLEIVGGWSLLSYCCCNHILL